MRRLLRSLILGLAIGAVLGLYLGWTQFPRESYRSDMSGLAQTYRDEYLVMIAAGYAADGDLPGALERLRPLTIDDLATYTQENTERIIESAARNIRDIRLLVGLAQGLGRVTAEMAPFLGLSGGQR